MVGYQLWGFRVWLTPQQIPLSPYMSAFRIWGEPIIEEEKQNPLMKANSDTKFKHLCILMWFLIHPEFSTPEYLLRKITQKGVSWEASLTSKFCFIMAFCCCSIQISNRSEELVTVWSTVSFLPIPTVSPWLLIVYCCKRNYKKAKIHKRNNQFLPYDFCSPGSAHNIPYLWLHSELWGLDPAIIRRQEMPLPAGGHSGGTHTASPCGVGILTMWRLCS